MTASEGSNKMPTPTATIWFKAADRQAERGGWRSTEDCPNLGCDRGTTPLQVALHMILGLLVKEDCDDAPYADAPFPLVSPERKNVFSTDPTRPDATTTTDDDGPLQRLLL